MADMKCKCCGNQYHWKEAFSKFGFDDGDGEIETPYIAQTLVDAGYAVKYSRWSPHNILIYSIEKNGIELMPKGSLEYLIGYDDPEYYLPVDILDLFNTKFPTKVIFQ